MSDAVWGIIGFFVLIFLIWNVGEINDFLVALLQWRPK